MQVLELHLAGVYILVRAPLSHDMLELYSSFTLLAVIKVPPLLCYYVAL